MKTVKSIIVVLFVLLTAQIASAYYCPSTGRWLSRDPIGEPGFQALQMASVVRSVSPSRWINRDQKNGINLYATINNNSICNIDILGLESWSWDYANTYAGVNCCPACSINQLKNLLRDQKNILNLWNSALSSGGTKWPGDLNKLHDTTTTLGETTVTPVTLNPSTKINVNPTGCIGQCVVAHEAVHRDQILNHYGDYHFPDAWKDIIYTAEIEKPATEAGITCLENLIKVADYQKRIYGSYAKACCACVNNQPYVAPPPHIGIGSY